jgi:hypothetical protein
MAAIDEIDPRIEGDISIDIDIPADAHGPTRRAGRNGDQGFIFLNIQSCWIVTAGGHRGHYKRSIGIRDLRRKWQQREIRVNGATAEDVDPAVGHDRVGSQGRVAADLDRFGMIGVGRHPAAHVRRRGALESDGPRCRGIERENTLGSQ